MGKDGKHLTLIVNITGDFVVQIKASCNADATLDLLNDTYRFLFSHNQAISESAMHTYYSALPFTPHNTRLYRLYEQETSHSITVLQGLSPTWTSCLSTLSLLGGSTILSISPDGTQLAANLFRSISILDAQTTAFQCQICLTDRAVCIAFSPSESTLATVTSKGLELWNTTTGINQKTQTLSGTHFYAVAFSSQGQYLLLSIDQGLHLHDGMEAGELSVLSTDWNHKMIIFTSNDTQVITGSEEGYIHFFRLSGNWLSEIPERRIFNETEVSGLVLRHDGKRLASSGANGMIRIYDLPSRSPIATLRRPEDWLTIRAIAYHPKEDELVVGHGNCVVIWRQKEMPSDWMPSIHSSHKSQINGIAYSQNGTRIYTNTVIGDIKLWTTTVTQVQKPPKPTSNIKCYAVNQPTSLLATGSQDMSIILWNFTTGDYWKTLIGHTSWPESLSFSDDGVLLASGCVSRTTSVWDVGSGSRLHMLGPHYSYSNVLAFNKDNAHLTTATYNECFVWELKSGELLEQRVRQWPFDRDQRTPYHLRNLNGWQTVMEQSQSQGRKCKYGFCRPPGEYGIIHGPILGDRAALFCNDGRVLFLDISRVMDVYMDPARQIELYSW